MILQNQSGRIKHLGTRQFGFISRDDGQGDIWFHANDCIGRDARFAEFAEGDYVRFDIVPTADGRIKAKFVEKVTASARRP